MTTIPYNPMQVQELCGRMRLYGERLSPTQAWELLRRTRDFDLALTSLVMDPRPEWVTKILGGRARASHT